MLHNPLGVRKPNPLSYKTNTLMLDEMIYDLHSWLLEFLLLRHWIVVQLLWMSKQIIKY